MKIEARRSTLELAIAALKTLSITTHRLASSERHPLRSIHLRGQADRADEAAEEIRRAMQYADRNNNGG